MISGIHAVPINLMILRVVVQIVALFCILGTVRHKVLEDSEDRRSKASLMLEICLSRPGEGDLEAVFSNFIKQGMWNHKSWDESMHIKDAVINRAITNNETVKLHVLLIHCNFSNKEHFDERRAPILLESTKISDPGKQGKVVGTWIYSLTLPSLKHAWLCCQSWPPELHLQLILLWHKSCTNIRRCV